MTTSIQHGTGGINQKNMSLLEFELNIHIKFGKHILVLSLTIEQHLQSFRAVLVQECMGLKNPH